MRATRASECPTSLTWRIYDVAVTRNDRRMTVGYSIALVGAVGFLVGCFLPYYDFRYPGAPVPPVSVSIFRFQTVALPPAETVAAILYLFTGAATVACISLYGIARRRAGSVMALAAASVVWSLTWAGALISSTEGFEGIGYDVMLASLVVGSIGTVVVAVSYPREGAPRGPEASRVSDLNRS
jgi:hypothetical protein